MPLPSPILDDRSFEQLKDELVDRIPVYNPEWTDHNESDPGITLIHLFAHLGEALLYRFNQIPETTKLAFLRLLKLQLRAAVPSRAMVALTTKTPAGVAVDQHSPAQAGKTGFELDTEVYVLPLSAVAVAKLQTAAPTTSDTELNAIVQRIVDARNGLNPNEVKAHYQSKPLAGDPSRTDFEGVDFGATVDDILWVAVLRDIDLPDDDIQQNIKKHFLNIGIVPFEPAPPMAQIDACPGAGAMPPPPAIIWQISVGLTDDRKTPQYRDLNPLGDTTRGLSQSGIVRFELPGDFVPLRTTQLDDPDREGTDNLPPPIEDEEQAKKVLFWLRAFRQDGGSLRRLMWVGANASIAVQIRTASPEYLGTGTAQPGQQARLVNRSIVPGTAQIEVEGLNGWTRWQEVDDFHASSRDDLHFTLDRDAGIVTFGNGIQGRAPQIGERIRAQRYCYGGGLAGNVPAGAINKIDTAGVKIANVMAARGGDDPETIDAALERIPSEFRRHDRAVAASDFRELALMTPGAEVGRAEVMPLFDPRHTGDQTPGVVSVVIWPREDPRQPDAPMPDRTLLANVCRWLDARRLVTTELYVIPPTYRRIAVSVGIEVKNGYGVEAVRRWVELVIRQYLAPLPPYGPSGQGWPLGRRVHGPELESAALQVEGVEFLHGLFVASYSDTIKNWVHTTQPTVTLAPWEVPRLSEITIVSGRVPGPAGTSIVPPPARLKPLPGQPSSGQPDARTAIPVPIPTPREKC